MAERRAVSKQMAKRYSRAPKKEKGRLLDELCALTGWSRRQARRSLHQAVHGVAPPVRRSLRRLAIYGDDPQDALVKVWATLGGICGKRLAPFMSEIVEVLVRCGELTLTEAQRERLCAMSAATIDRRLAPERGRLKVKQRSGTKPGMLLKGRIPIKTFSEWDDATPGFCQVDLVAHDGGMASGDYCQSLDLTDVATGWTEPGALKNKAQVWVFEELKRIREDLPFDLLGLDSDNGAEFINAELQRYCEAERITFTRGRAYRKNDSCYVEQKNWSVIRQAVGYARYDTGAELGVLRELYGSLRLWVNFFQPVMKLTEKTREGAKVKKRYDRAQTPYQRVLASPHVSAAAKRRLTKQYETLNPAELRRQIGRSQDELLRLGRLKERRRQAEARAAGNGAARRSSTRDKTRSSGSPPRRGDRRLSEPRSRRGEASSSPDPTVEPITSGPRNRTSLQPMRGGEAPIPRGHFR
jgi:hypothetical protein